MCCYETRRLGGRERLVLAIPSADFVERLALWLGPREGVTRIHTLEVRARTVSAESPDSVPGGGG